MNSYRIFLVSILAILMLSLPSWAINEDAGTAGVPFLRLDVGGRQAALGGSGVAYTEDAYAMHWNVAALSVSRSHRVAFQHNEYFQDMNHEYLAYAGPLFEKGAWGISINYFNAGDMDKTIETAGGAYGGRIGTFDASDMALELAYSHRMNDELNLGIGVKYISSKIDTYDASGFGADLGVLYRPASIKGLSLGASVTNIGQGLKFVRERDDLPMVLRTGASYTFYKDKLQVSLDLNKPRDNDLYVNTGLEWHVVRMLALRVGYTSQNDDVGEGLTAGAGFNMSDFHLDYAYVPFGDLGESHRVSMSYSFGGDK